MKNLVIFTIFVIFLSPIYTFSQKINLKYDNGNHELFNNYKELLFKLDDSLKVLKNDGFVLAEVEEFNKIDSLNYSVKIKKYSQRFDRYNIR